MSADRRHAWRAFAWSAVVAALPVFLLGVFAADVAFVHGYVHEGFAVAAATVVGAVLLRGATALAHELVKLHRLGRREAGLGSLRVGGVAVRVVDEQDPVAYCRGALRPCIVVSRGAVEQLDAVALEAVVAHEEHHARHRDPLRLLGARVAVRTLPHAPVLTGLLQRFEQAAELAADAAAVRTQRGPSHLARALLAFAADRRGVEPWRVDALAGRPVTVRRLGPRAAVSLAALAALTVAGGVATSAVGHGPAELAAGLFG